MGGSVNDSLDYLANLGAANLINLFWLALLFEGPRHLLAAAAALILIQPSRAAADEIHRLGTVGVIIAGHNEAEAVVSCVKSLREQSLVPNEIVVVSDGSADAMRAVLRDLQRKGLITGAHATDLRAGKSAATNLAERLSSADILVNVDCDTTFDRHAIRNIVAPFADPGIGAVSGNILVRNASATLFATLQAIEYLVSISLGKRAQAMLGQVSCASGAFSAFRRQALQRVGGLDVGGGEDLDLTLRLRKLGIGIAFAPDAVCRTDVPAGFSALVRQRLRWERDAVRLRFRTHGETLNPFSGRFSPRELFHETEFLLFNVIGALSFPVYIAWLFANFGDAAPVILGAAFFGLMLIDVVMLAVAGLAMPGAAPLHLLAFVPAFSLFYGVVMRSVRLAAYAQEWAFSSSHNDEYVPQKVRATREWGR